MEIVKKIVRLEIKHFDRLANDARKLMGFKL